MSSFLSPDEISERGFAHVGEDVRVSRLAAIYNAANISLGDHARIDDFCVLSAGSRIEIGAYVHIAVHCSLMGAGRIVMEDFSGLSSRVSIYSSNDDYSGRALTNPTVPEHLRGVTSAPVRLGRHAIIGCGAVILPGTDLDTGAVVGSLSLMRGKGDAFTVYAGVPARAVKARRRDLLELETRLP